MGNNFTKEPILDCTSQVEQNEIPTSNTKDCMPIVGENEMPDPNTKDCMPKVGQKEVTYKEFGKTYYLGSVLPYMYEKVDGNWIYKGDAVFTVTMNDGSIDTFDDVDLFEYYDELEQSRENIVIQSIYYIQDSPEFKYHFSKIMENKLKIIFTERHIEKNQELVDSYIETHGLPSWWKIPTVVCKQRQSVYDIREGLKHRYNIHLPFDIQEKLCLLSTAKAKELLKKYLSNYL